MARDRDLPGEIEELFADLWQVPRFAGFRRGFRPSVDCIRTDDPPALTFVLELAGVDPARIGVDVSPHALVVAGDRGRPPVRGRVLQMEIEVGPFERRLQLPEEIDAERATATYDSGLLTIVLPIAQRPPPPAKVAIQVRSQA